MADYYNREHLNMFNEGALGEEANKMWEKFLEYYGTVNGEDTALTVREKSLIALGVAHAISCPYCMEQYTKNCLQNGCDEEEIIEAIHVAASLQAGATLAHGIQSKELLDKLGM